MQFNYVSSWVQFPQETFSVVRFNVIFITVVIDRFRRFGPFSF